MIENLANHQRQAPGLERGQQMAPGGARPTVHEKPRGLIRLTKSSCLQQTSLLCGVFVTVLAATSPERLFVYRETQRCNRSHSVI